MNWYLAKLVYQISCGNGNHTGQFDEQLRLIFADDHLHAFHKARLIGEEEAMEVPVDKQLSVAWKFIDVSELLPLVSEMDSTEINSITSEQENAEAYIRNTRVKARQLLQQGLHQFTSLIS